MRETFAAIELNLSRSRRFFLLALFVTLSGCANLAELGFTNPFAFGNDDEMSRQAEKYRQDYQLRRDPQAIRWLLAHRLERGMSLADVGHELGEEGQRDFHDLNIKMKGSKLRTDDLVYGWGPDSDGKSYYLGFRQDRLLNFDPEDYRSD